MGVIQNVYYLQYELALLKAKGSEHTPINKINKFKSEASTGLLEQQPSKQLLNNVPDRLVLCSAMCSSTNVPQKNNKKTTKQQHRDKPK